MGPSGSPETRICMRQDEKPNAEEKKGPKKPYQKPEFRYERVFETMALACGKIGNLSANCHGRPRRS